EIRRRIRASAGLTYLNDVVAASADSGLHRWDNRTSPPVRVYLPTATVANFQPAFLDAVRNAFQAWEQAGVPVRFALDADSASAEVRFQWRIQFEGERTGQTDLEWEADGRRGDPRDLRSQGTAAHLGRPARDGDARDRTLDRPRSFARSRRPHVRR